MNYFRYLWLGYLLPTVEKSEEILDNKGQPCVYSRRKPDTHKGTYIRLIWLGIQVGFSYNVTLLTLDDMVGVQTEEHCPACEQGRLSVDRLGDKWCTQCTYATSIFDE